MIWKKCICRSIEFKIELLKLIKALRSVIDVLIKIRSSAYKKLLRHLPFRLQPRWLFASTVNKISMKVEKKRGDKMPPCLTPEVIGTGSERELFQITRADPILNQWERTSTTTWLIRFFWRRHKIPHELVLSKAFLISMKPRLTVKPFLLKYWRVFFTKLMAGWHPVPCLKPNCLGEELNF